MDVTSSIQESCRFSTGPNSTIPNSTICQWSVPGGATLGNPSIPFSRAGRQSTVFKVDYGPGKIWNVSDTAAGASLQIMDFNVIGQSRDEYTADTPTGTPTKLKGVRAYECALWFCLQAHRTNISLGIADQGAVSQWNMARGLKAFYGIGISTIYSFTDIPAEFNTEPDVKSGVGSHALQAAQTGIQELLFGTVIAQNAGEVSYFGPLGNNLDGLRGLWNASANMEGWMGNLTRSLSNNVRLTGSTRQINGTKYDGVAWTEEAYIKVQWLWIIFPWALVLVSIGFLLITIAENSQQRPWKNTPSAMLYTRLDDQLQEQAMKANTQNRELTVDFDQTTVKLNHEEWTFQPVSSAGR